MRTRPVSIAHLVFGLIFLGAALLWSIGAATDADAPDLAVLAPGVLVAAGAIGLVGIVINARNARVQAQRATDETPDQEPGHADTGVLDQEQS
jgi:hypothetical protein